MSTIENNIKMYHREIVCGELNWIQVLHNTFQLPSGNTIINLHKSRTFFPNGVAMIARRRHEYIKIS